MKTLRITCYIDDTDKPQTLEIDYAIRTTTLTSVRDEVQRSYVADIVFAMVRTLLEQAGDAP